MKKSAIFLLSSALLFGTLGTSCSSFMGSDAYSIENVTSKLNNDGSTTVTIEFTDGSGTPDYTFTIPMGNGIKDVVAVNDLENSIVKVTISFTDPSIEDYVVNLPIVKGPGIESITEGIDEATGNKVMIISFTDDRPDVKFPLPQGEKGLGIKEIRSEIQDDRTVKVEIEFDDGNITNLTIPAPLDGVGVKTITVEVDVDTGKNKLIFELSDGTRQEVLIDRATIWYSGSDDPNSMDAFGFNGDFYFETIHYIIYQKSAGVWIQVANLGGASISTKHTITFDLNDKFDGGPHAKFTSGETSYAIPEGWYFAALGYEMPLASREGYKFNGWYRTALTNPTSGAFTDTTPIYRSEKLFANWIKL